MEEALDNIILKDPRKHFQYFGFDFIIDENFRTGLIEVNQNPSLTWETKWSEKYLPFFIEEIVKNAVDPFFYAGKISPIREKYPKVPELPWANKVTKKKLPKWFVPVTEKVPFIKDHSFELIFSTNKFLYNIPHQKYILNHKKVTDVGFRFLWYKNKDFYYPFGTAKSLSRSKSPIRSNSRSKSPIRSNSKK